MRPLLGLIHFFLSPRPARWISPIFHPLLLGPCQGCAVSFLLFNMCEAICQNSGPCATPVPTPGTREETSFEARQCWPLSPRPAEQDRLWGLGRSGNRRRPADVGHQLLGGKPAQEGEGSLVGNQTAWLQPYLDMHGWAAVGWRRGGVGEARGISLGADPQSDAHRLWAHTRSLSLPGPQYPHL